MHFCPKSRRQCLALSITLTSLTFSIWPTPLPAVAQQMQNGQTQGMQPFAPTGMPSQNPPGVYNANTANGIPKDLTPQQKYLRDTFLFKKLKEIDELVKQDHHVQARQMLEELVTLDPNPYSKDVHGLLAESCYKLGNNPEAIKNYELSIQFDHDKDVQPYWNIALAYMNLNQYDQATIWCKKLLAKNPPANMRAQAERFINDVGKERSEQDAFHQGSDDEGDYLSHLTANREANRWPREKLPIKVFIEDDRNVPGFRSQFVEIFLSCLEIWTKATRNRLSFTTVNSLNEADLNLRFTAEVNDIAREPGMAPTEQGLATIKAFIRGPGYGTIDKARIQILVHKPSSSKLLTDDEIKEVCLHELGHALGLSGHSPNDSDTMHFMMSFRQLPALTKRDKQTIARLYQDYPAYNQTASSNYQPSNVIANGQYQQQQPYTPQFQQQQMPRPQQPQFNQQAQYPPQQSYQQPPSPEQYQPQPAQQPYQNSGDQSPSTFPSLQQFQQMLEQQSQGQGQGQGQYQNQNQQRYRRQN